MVYSKAIFSTLLIAAMAAIHPGSIAAQTPPPLKWQSPAQFRQILKKQIAGTLTLDDNGVAFQSLKFSQRWPYDEISTFELRGNRELAITGYENRHWHEPGERTFRFTLSQSMPAEIAAAFTTRVGRPVVNGDPGATAPATLIAALPVHRREFIGGSNGTLRLRLDGIDYVAKDGVGSRSWRWSDIRTLARPNPWELRVGAYRETVEFDLKKPLSHELFDRLWNYLYTADLNLAPGKDGAQ